MIQRLQILLVGTVIVAAAFATGLPFLFYLVYLGLLAVGGSYVLTRLGLTDLEAGYAVDRLRAHVGEEMRTTYTLRNTSRVPKPWLEVHNPTDLPVAVPGRALSLGPTSERAWVARVPLTRRGTFRIEPLQIRTGDPFGFFEAGATVGHAVSLTVYPRIDALPRWRLPAANIEGSHSAPERTLQTTPLATTVRPYAPGDSFNRIHWKTTARYGDIQVKEFDLEQTADAWVFLDLDASVQAGVGDESTVEVAVRAAASITDRAVGEKRAVGLTANGHRTVVLPADRGSRQHQKIMQLLAAVDGDGETPLVETLVTGLPRLRRGMTAVVITPSLDRAWVRPLAGLRARGVACLVISLDAASYERAARTDLLSRNDGRQAGERGAAGTGEAAEQQAQASRALHHALAEYELRNYTVRAGDALGAVLVG